VKDRRATIRTHVKRQLEGIASGLSSARTIDLELALTNLYAEDPVRWQAFMNEAAALIATLGRDNSGFSETVQTLD